VINALTAAGRMNPQNARLVARHHHTGVGLECVTRPAVNAADRGVKDGVFKNTASTHPVVDRCLSGLSLIALYNLAAGHKMMERAKSQARETLRSRFGQSAPEQKAEFIIATECGMVYRLQRDIPDKRFYGLATVVCPNMKKTTLEKVVGSLRELQHQIEIPEEIAARARQAVERMIAVG